MQFGWQWALWWGLACVTAAGDSGGTDAPKGDEIRAELNQRQGALDPHLARVRHKTDSPCLVRIVSPQDEGIVNFYTGSNVTISFSLECSKEDYTEWEKSNPGGFIGGIMIHGEPILNYSVPGSVDTFCCPHRVFSMNLEVTQWFDSNLVVLCHPPSNEPVLSATCTVATRTIALGEKHLLGVWMRPAAWGPQHGDAVLALAEMPVFFEHQALQIDLLAELHVPLMPSVLSVRLILGKKRAVKVTPEWRLPELHSDAPPLLHVTVAYIPPVGKYPVRVELWDLQQGMVAHLSTYFDVVAAHNVNAPLKKEGGDRQKYVPPPREEEEGEIADEADGDDGGFRERDDTSMFCSRRGSALDSGGTLKSWHHRRGDEVLRFEYPLTSTSTVLDLGGYHGKWARDILQRYGCSVHVFEPVKRFYDVCTKLLEAFPSARTYNFALGAASGVNKVVVDGLSSRLSSEGKEEVVVKTLPDVMKEFKIERADLIKINIEGGEFELLDHMAVQGLIPLFDNIQVQFHLMKELGEEASLRAWRQRIQGELNKTHCLTYSFPFIWENWRIRGSKERHVSAVLQGKGEL